MSQEANMNMSDYLDFNFGDVLQAPSSPFNPFNEYDFPSPSQPHSHPVPGPSNANPDLNATASTSTSSHHASPWSPPGLTYSLTSPEETTSNVSPTMGADFGAFSPVLVNDYLTDPEGTFGINEFDYPNRAYDGKRGQAQQDQDVLMKGMGSFGNNNNTINNNNNNNNGTSDMSNMSNNHNVTGAVGTTFDLQLPSSSTSRDPSPFSEYRVKQEPMTDPLQFLPFDASGMGGTVNTADLFGSIPMAGAGMGMNVGSKSNPNSTEGKVDAGFNGSIVFGNEDVGMLGDYLVPLQQLQQQLQQQGVMPMAPTQQSEDEGDSVNAASPAAHSVASTSSRKPSTGTTAPTVKPPVQAGSKLAAKRSVAKKTAMAKQSRSASVSQDREPEYRGDKQDDEDEDDDEDSHSRRGSEDMETLPLPAMFGGVKGKGGKKGGGMSSVVLEDGEEAGEEDDWRPSAEEYKKMSSKEKRQLRNKLSARAFRNRRKTYINELEDHIKDRDRLIDAIRNELKNFRSENDELRREIGMMKKAALEPNEEMTPVKTPGRSATASSSSTTKSSSSSSSFPISTFNPRKDLPASTSALLNQMSPRSMWGEGAGGYTSVHTTFMPDLALPSTLQLNIPRQNLNPHLNIPAEPVTKAPHPFKSDGNNLGDSFDAWSSETPFSYRSLEAYRMQLWSRMARDASLAKQGVPLDMRPKFLKEPTEHKAAVVDAAVVAQASSPDQIAAAPVLSNVISSAISTRLFSAFLSAFQSPTGRGLDGDRVAAVFTGKAGLKVVNNGPTSPPLPAAGTTPASSRSDIDADAALAASFAHLKVATESLGIKSPDSSSTSSKSLPTSDEDSRGWGFLSRSVVRG